MKELSLREIQMGEFAVLKKLKALCEALNLRYYLYYGTLLGAVRHQGFIPWDDDVDVAMPRPDYEILLDYCAKHEKELSPFRLMTCRKNKEYIYPISRLCDTRYYVDYEGTVEYGLGLFVDIYPLDGCGNTREEIDKIHKKNNFLQRITLLAGTNRFRSSAQGGFLRSAVKFAGYCYAKLLTPRYFALKAERNSLKFDYESSKYVACSVWFEFPQWSEKDVFAEPATLTFEGEQFSVPSGYDRLMKDWYGDYMQLPPEDQQRGHHYYKAYLKDEFAQ